MSKVKCLWKSQFTQCYGLCSIQSRAICGVLGTSSGENGEVVDARLDQSILWAGHSGNWGCCKFSRQGCKYLKGFNYPSSVCPPPKCLFSSLLWRFLGNWVNHAQGWYEVERCGWKEVTADYRCRRQYDRVWTNSCWETIHANEA